MKTCFLNCCFLNKFTSLLVLTISGLFVFTSCKCKRGCEGLDSVTEQYIAQDVQAALDIRGDTVWIFECVSTHDHDTLILRDTLQRYFQKGDCAIMDKGKCCSDYFYQKSNRNLEVDSSSGRNNFTGYYTDEEGLGMKGKWGKILILNHMYSQDFPQRFVDSLRLTVADTLLMDTKSGLRILKPNEVDDGTTPFLVYWSKANGLVMYAYKTATDTLKYERINLVP